MVSPAIFDHEKLSGVSQKFKDDDEHEDEMRVLGRKQHSEEQ